MDLSANLQLTSFFAIWRLPYPDFVQRHFVRVQTTHLLFPRVLLYQKTLVLNCVYSLSIHLLLSVLSTYHRPRRELLRWWWQELPGEGRQYDLWENLPELDGPDTSQTHPHAPKIPRNVRRPNETSTVSIYITISIHLSNHISRPMFCCLSVCLSVWSI